jgi:hypothetical protein
MLQVLILLCAGIVSNFIPQFRVFQFDYFLSEDGSGKGAGMVAAIAKRLQERKTDC